MQRLYFWTLSEAEMHKPAEFGQARLNSGKPGRRCGGGNAITLKINKMKINWGTGVVLAFIAFIGFIMFFVVTMSTDKKYDHELVTEEYYKKELGYQDKINAEQKTLGLGIVPQIDKTPDGLLIQFSDRFEVSQISGTVFLYRPSNKQLDFEIPLSLSNPYLLIPNARLLDGRWNIEINWSYQGEQYFNRKEITF